MREIMMNDGNYSFPYPDGITSPYGGEGWTISIRTLYELVARDAEDRFPRWAEFMRSCAECFQETYPDGSFLMRDRNGNIVDLDTGDFWDELTDEEKLHRGNTNAAIAALDRLRYDLEMAQDDASLAADVTRIRREIAAIEYTGDAWDSGPDLEALAAVLTAK